MKSVIFKRYNNLPTACVDFSTLEAGGFHPSFNNYYHAHISALQLIAYGGIIIIIPEQEYHKALAFLKDMQQTPMTDFDPIAPRRFGMWKRGTVFSLASGIFLPIFFLAPELLLVIWVALFIYDEFHFRAIASFWLFMPLILLHAKYIAVPKLRETP